MGPDFVNSFRFQIFGWIVILGIIAVNFYLVSSQFLDPDVSGLPNTWWMFLILAIVIFAYITLIIAILRNDIMYAFMICKRSLKRSVSADGLPEAAAEGDEFENMDALTLESRFDQPEEGSPAWIIAERLAGRNSSEEEVPPSDIDMIDDEDYEKDSSTSRGCLPAPDVLELGSPSHPMSGDHHESAEISIHYTMQPIDGLQAQ